jgi:DNA primase
VETRVLVLPENLDPDTFICKKGVDAWDKLAAGAASGLKFVIDYASRGKKLNVPEVKTRVLRQVMDVVEAVPDAVVRSEFLRLTAEQLGVEESMLRALSKGGKPSDGAAAKPETFFQAEKRLLQILIEDKALRPYIFSEICEKDVCGLKSEPIFTIMFGLFKENRDFVLNEIQRGAGPELSREFSQALLDPGAPPCLEEAMECLNALRIASLEGEIRRIQAEIAREEKSGRGSDLDDLMSRKQNLTRQVIALKQ